MENYCIMPKRNNNKQKPGFTLVELSIAIAFISMLLLSVALVISNTISSYKKGISMKLVNSAGRDLIDEFTNAIADSPSYSFESLCATYYDPAAIGNDNYKKCVEDSAYNLIYQQWYTKISRDGGVTYNNSPVFGVFCTGKYSYIWNTGYTFGQEFYTTLDAKNKASSDVPYAYLIYSFDGKDVNTDALDPNIHFRLQKIMDPNHAICAARITGAGVSYDPDFEIKPTESASQKFDITYLPGSNIKNPLPEAPVELISYSKMSLALYDFSVFSPAQNRDTKRLFYSASMVLGTISGGVDAMATNDYCTPPAGFMSDFSYCAVNKFNFAMRGTGN